ncbi:heme-binding domain-containing protein [Arcticibacterium luteifluviistationis]|uniref:Cytochrome C n=1 Tax=Arcticibacterium luteifluviistationis TaxID=1784714 RepID=A0A2Z4GGF0_9BACT|nr:heme-binding domain-containing protein [Arcticibacterium luteifluviistationis]AWW00158.1 cytochrome C [Arcticibacterium luteifluviistationis]
MIKKILSALLAILFVIQLIRPEKNVSDSVSVNDISAKYEVPEDVHLILKKACTDCHSNNTVYPWYANIQPVAWYLDDHIQDGKKHFDMSEFLAYEPWRAHHKLEELEEEVEENKMPLEDYVRIHEEADLTSDEKSKLIAWSRGVRAEMAADSTLDLTRPEKKK